MTAPAGQPWLAHLRPGISEIPLRARPADPPSLNLKSNELLHPLAQDWARAALDQISSLAVVRYPRSAEAERAVASFHGIREDQVLLTAGSDQAIGVLVAAIVATSGRLVLPRPDYEAWAEYAALHSISMTTLPFNPADELPLVADRLCRAAGPAPAAVALSAPNGFTGQSAATRDLVGLARRCDRLGHVLIIDTCYRAFDASTSMTAAVAELIREPGVLVVNSYSKSLGVAGARIAAVFGPPEVLAYLRRWRPHSSLSGVTIALLLSALADPERPEKWWQDIRQWRAGLARAIESAVPAWQCPDTATNFLTIDTGSEAAAAKLTRKLAERSIRVRRLDGSPQWDRRVRCTVPPPADWDRLLSVCQESAP